MNSVQPEKQLFPWGHERRFNAYSFYIKKLFGSRVQKVSVDAGFTCPNRDGIKGIRGCTYCNNNAFNPSYCNPGKSVSLQIEEGIRFHKKRYRKATSFLAYFQAYSNTYASAGRLRELYEEAVNYPGIAGIIIGTRPDCIDEEKLDYIVELSKRCYIVVEFGIESCYDRTLKRINRGHSFEEAEAAVKATAARGINTGAHFIFGLPGETRDDMLAEAGIISRLPLKTVKFRQLQIIKGTVMEQEFRNNPSVFQLFTWEDYLDFIVTFLERFTPSIMVERLTGEAPPRFLTGENWGKKRTDQIMNLIEKHLEELNTWQGRCYKT